MAQNNETERIVSLRVRAMADDLRAAGFAVRENLAGGVLVSLDARPVFRSEVVAALADAGYEPGQYRAEWAVASGQIVVTPVVA